jgi:single-stranded DNA-binding protein
MAVNNYSGSGRVIAVKELTSAGGEAYVSITVNVPTGGKKQNGAQYAPSNIFSLLIFGAGAQFVLSQDVQKGDKIAFTGQLGEVTTYESKGKTGVNLTILNAGVDITIPAGEDDLNDAPVVASKKEVTKQSAPSKAGKKVQTPPPEVDETYFDLDDVEIDE